MFPGLPLHACLAIAHMVERTAPFDPDFALRVIAELDRELQFDEGFERSASPTPAVPTIGNIPTRAGQAMRIVGAAIAEIHRRLDAAALSGWRPVG